MRTERKTWSVDLLNGPIMKNLVIFMIPILITYSETGLVPRIPTLIVCSFTVLAAINAFFAGQILRSIQQKNRADFEMEYRHAGNRFRDLKKMSDN